MPSTYTANTLLQKVAYDEQAETWGYSENQNWDRVDNLISGRLVIDVTGLGATITLTSTPGLVDQASNCTYIFTGALGQDTTVLLPALNHNFVALNSTTGSFKLTLGVTNSPSGTQKTLPVQVSFALTCDGSNISPAPNGTLEFFTVATADPANNANLVYTVPGRTYVTYAEALTGRWHIRDQTASRNSLTVNPEDGAVSIPFGGIKSYVGTVTNVSGWAIQNTGTMQIKTVGAANGWGYVAFYNNGTLAGDVAFQGGGVQFFSVSDYRLKISHGPFRAWSLPDLPVHDAAWKNDPHLPQPMFLAHEVAIGRPWAVIGEKDAVDENGDIIPQRVASEKLIPEMWAMIQSLRSSVNALEGDRKSTRLNSSH